MSCGFDWAGQHFHHPCSIFFLPPESVTLPDSPTFHTFDASTNPAYILIFFAGSSVPWAQICHSHRSLLHETVVESGMEMQVIELLYTYIKIWPCRFISIFHQIRKQFVTSRISISSLVIGMAWKPAAVLHLQSSNDMVRSSAQKERKMRADTDAVAQNMSSARFQTMFGRSWSMPSCPRQVGRWPLTNTQLSE